MTSLILPEGLQSEPREEAWSKDKRYRYIYTVSVPTNFLTEDILKKLPDYRKVIEDFETDDGKCLPLEVAIAVVSEERSEVILKNEKIEKRLAEVEKLFVRGIEIDAYNVECRVFDSTPSLPPILDVISSKFREK